MLHNVAMPEPIDREKHELEMITAFWLIWMAWSDVSSVSELSRESLRRRVMDSTEGTARSVWQQSYETVLDQFGARRVPRQEEAFFRMFHEDVSSSLSNRWMSRVESYLEDQERDKPYRPRWEHVRGRGQKVLSRIRGGSGISWFSQNEDPPNIEQYGPTGITDMAGDIVYHEYYDPETKEFFWVSEYEHPEDDRLIVGARPLVYPSDAEREGVSWVTGCNSFGENFAVRQIESQGIAKLKGVWQTERDRRVCPICSPLHGKPPWVWKPKFPDGPPAHTNCRCWRVWKQYFEPGDGYF